MARRWARPIEHGSRWQMALPFEKRDKIPGLGHHKHGICSERPRIETDRVALGPAETSREAAAVAQQSAAHRRRIILACIRGQGPRGATLDEVAAAIGAECGQISGRFTDLGREGLIVRNGERRATRKGSSAAVWVATE